MFLFVFYAAVSWLLTLCVLPCGEKGENLNIVRLNKHLRGDDGRIFTFAFHFRFLMPSKVTQVTVVPPPFYTGIGQGDTVLPFLPKTSEKYAWGRTLSAPSPKNLPKPLKVTQND